MSDQTTLDSLPLSMLGVIIDHQRREEITKEAFDYRNRAAPGSRQRLEQVLQAAIRINGYRNAALAPTEWLVQAAVNCWHYQSQFVAAILQVWAEAHADLRVALATLLESQHIPINIPIKTPRLEIWSEAEVDQIIHDFQADYPDYATADIQVMLVYLTAHVPIATESGAELIPDDQDSCAAWDGDPTDQIDDMPDEFADGVAIPQFSKETISMQWQQWIEQIRELPADAPEWDAAAFGAFLQAVQAIASEKSQAREQVRDPLRQALTRLVEETTPQLHYFGFTASDTWIADRIALNDIPALVLQLDQFREALLEHDHLRLQPAAASFAETSARRKQLTDLEEQITWLYELLSEQFSVHPLPEPPAPPPETDSTDSVEPDMHTAPEPDTDPGNDESSVSEPADTSPNDASAMTVQTQFVPGIDPPEPPHMSDDITGMSSDQVDTTGADLHTVCVTETPAELETWPEDGAISAEEPPASIPAVPGVENAANDDRTASATTPTDPPPVITPQTGPDSADVPDAGMADGSTTEPAEPDMQPGSRSARDIALLLQNDSADEHWHALQWALIAEDDLAGAYWLARSRQAAGFAVPVPDWLVAAVQSARLVSSDSEAFISDLREITTNYQPAESTIQETIGLAAALYASVVAPATGLAGWLRIPNGHEFIRDLVHAIKQFTNTGIVLRSEDLLGVAGVEQRNMAIREASRTAADWLRVAPDRSTGYVPATSVWRTLLGRKGELYAMLEPVAKDDRSAWSEVSEKLERWSQRDYALVQIHQISKTMNRGKWRPIDGDPREHLLRDIQEACGVALQWCQRVEREHQIQRRGDWLFEQISQLHEQIKNTQPEIVASLDELRTPAQMPALAAAAICLHRSLHQIWAMFGLAEDYPSVEHPPLPGESLWAGSRTLPALHNRYVLWLPDVTLSDTGDPVDESLPTISVAVSRAYAEDRSLQAAFEHWIERQDYRFNEILLDALRGTADSGDDTRRSQEALYNSRATLQHNIAHTENEIEQAIIDGVITEEERSQYSTHVSLLKPEDVQHFVPHYDQLRQIREALLQARQSRLQALHTIWQTVQLRLPTSNITAEKQEQICTFITKALADRDTRIVDECLAHLKEVLDTGSDLEENWVTAPISRDILVEFLDAEQPIREWFKLKQNLHVVASDIQDGRTLADIRFRNVPVPRRKEAAEAIRTWRMVKQSPPERFTISINALAKILSYLGFTLTGDIDTSLRVEKKGDDWAYVCVSMSASDLAKPIPQFGSQSQGRYDVICLWERPGIDTIAARVQELRLNLNSVLVFYFGGLTAQQRRDVMRLSHEKELALAVLDELLLVFLAQEHDARLRPFLRCALPFAAVNPYTPFQAGNVPPEMFFGREPMARELQRSDGSCLVYGGRQLGKSALLRHVQRQFHHPERNQYAWVEDIKLIGDPLGGQPLTDTIWRKLRDGFRHHGLITNRISTEKPDDIERYLREAMEHKPDRRVLILFDEADNFLEADAQRNFAIVERLRALMFTTQRRFKVVFAGLHNVQRFQGIPNQPLAHFGTPLRIGPLEPVAAQRLVRDPLEALGYRFTDDATILRILSYTNYHPGLIQIFCQDLLKQFHGRGSSTLPPYAIEQSDVEAIYRDPLVRDRIRERFDWTLALDMRYQAIAWAMIVEQIAIRDSYAQAYTSGDLLSMVQAWWPRGFGSVGTDQVRGLLDEMCGLGVLVRNTGGLYRLRSPNLVRLMGTERDVEAHLEELMDKQPPASFDADYHHAPLGDTRPLRYSPLTYAQDRRLNPSSSGVGLVFASEALGLSLLPEAFRQAVPHDLSGNGTVCEELPPDVLTEEQVRPLLEQCFDTHAHQERMVVYCRPAHSDAEQLANLVRMAVHVCQRQHTRTRHRWMRVLFMFDPQTTWTWLSLPYRVRDDLENCVDAVEYPRRWNEVGIRQRLAQNDKMDTPEVHQYLAQVTGGWPFLLDQIFSQSKGHDDLRPFAQAMEHELQSPDSSTRTQFLRTLGIPENSVARHILQFIHHENQVPLDLVRPELMRDLPGVTLADCENAVAYLQRLACIDVHNGMCSVEPVVGKVLE